jgi:hypothetical protein
MSDPVLVAMIVAAQGAVVAWINSRNHASTKKAIELVDAKVDLVDTKVVDTHSAINGRMTELIEASKAQGAQDQRMETRTDAREAKENARNKS